MKRLWTIKHSAPFALTALAAIQATPSAEAQPSPVNRYTFNDGAVTDIISGQNGTLVDPSGIAFYSGGQVRLTNNNNFSSAQDFSSPTANGAYVDLPNGLISSAANNGSLYQFSLEFWATVQTNRDWARLGDFGTSVGGEDVSGSGATTDYLIVVPRTGGRPTPEETNKFSVSSHSAGGQEDFISAPSELAAGVEHHVVVTVDQTDFTGGGNGTLSLYLNGSLVNSGPVEDEGFIDFTLFSDNNNWLGRAQWGDPLFDGSYNEFSVYDYSLSAQDVLDSFNAGPVPGELAVPQLVVNRDTGEVTVNNATGEQLSLLSYSIASESGSIDNVAWTSIDATNFDANGVWTSTSDTPELIAEGTTGDGGQIASAAGRTIGNAWNPSPYEDLVFNFTLAGGSPLAGEVVYVGNDGAAIANTDLNADGVTDADDFYLFAAASQGDLSGMSAYELYKNGDLNGDGANNYVDFRLFKDAFIAANGAAAFAALAASVPEPTSLLLVVGAGVGLAFRRR
ncbi:LamG-like jellyroll fold domain-containing protein [Botrimarina mediterranea]|uniref:Ice-binding protein C-terminal domain-containing protein n=1 Tax=Botrimarina mediterranea TaxID=2528022 RepID=A0A518K8G5_9BACT|nr:LamG-like jellyroll fold domain-containing protein [Botrimarina mediterranea]QDV74079.1 hypothetical protein Spa11_22780 [Botrimarina mediterranea]QDV78709.1 hypothetical protein K2D_23160 [Planctomycetes bacterium K2D]